MARERFMKAYDLGRWHALGRQEAIELVILELMGSNPFKGVQARAEYVQGVSDHLNEREARATHKLVYGG